MIPVEQKWPEDFAARYRAAGYWRGETFGQMLRDHLIDELFLTLAPQVAGRSGSTPRLALVEDTAFTVAEAPWSRLVDLRRSDNHLFARYRFEEGHS